MSRTPELIPIKGALTLRNWLIGIGVFFAMVTFAAFQNGGNPFWPLVITGGAFGIASKVRTHKEKEGEVGIYR
jgi:hypothetical protein